MKILTIVGARPQFIKAAVVSREIARQGNMSETLLHTGQHYDPQMSEIFFSEMNILEPTYNLGISGGSHGQMTGRQLEAIEQILLKNRPDVLLVYGDTNSTLAGALAAAKLEIPVAHVEAGLRSFNRAMPEEINRVLTDHISEFLFVPSAGAVENLKNEGIAGNKIIQSGDVMYDAALYYSDLAQEKSRIIEKLGLSSKKFRLCTVHRQENSDNPERLITIFSALREISQDMPLVLPLHPRTRKKLSEQKDFASLTKGLTIIEPVGFFDIICLLKAAHTVLTDSGGLQKEAYFHGTPVIILRDETEWMELVELQWAELVSPTSPGTIIEALARQNGQTGSKEVFPYGKGNAAKAIISHLNAHLS